MQLKTEIQEGVLLVNVGGRLDTETASNFSKEVDRLLKDGPTQVVVNLAQLDFINSSGLSSFIHLAQQLSKSGGRLALCELNGMVAEVFQAAQLGPLIPNFETEALALSALKSG